MGLAPHGAGTERVPSAHVPGQRGGSRSQPLTAAGGLSSPAPAPQRSRPERRRGLPRSPGRRRRRHERALAWASAKPRLRWFPLPPALPLSAVGESCPAGSHPTSEQGALEVP